MATLELLLTILIGISIAHFAWNYEWKKSRPRGAPTVPLTTKRPFVIRVSGIRPDDNDESRVRSLVKAIAKLSDSENDCVGKITVVPSCVDPEKLVALVDFKVLPEILSFLKKGSSQVFEVPGQDDYYLDFNGLFLGLTQMYPTQKTPTADIVFISGIGSNAYGSWASKFQPWLMWPRHFLPKHLPHARVMVYGHKADINGTGFGELLDYSRSLSDALRQARKEDPGRPIVFVAHSFGGSILKSFLVNDQQQGGQIVKVTCGILFFAVPHRGMDIQDMMTAIKHRKTGEKRLAQIDENGPSWRQDHDNFVNIIKNCRVASFYEMELTKRLILKPDGSFARDGEYTVALDTRSALLDLPTKMESKHPVHADHSAIVKFESDSCQVFSQALSVLKECFAASRAPPDKLDEATAKFLSNLKVTDPDLDMERIENSKDPLLQGSYEWIFRNSKLLEWRENDTGSLLWLKGDPGKGKTMLMIALARELSKKSPGNPPSVTVFFCQSTDIRLNSAIAILRGLIWKLGTDEPRLARIIRQKYESDQSLLEGPNAVFALFSALNMMLSAQPGTAILIDALDECDPGPGRSDLLNLITKDARSSSKSKWLIASRNSPDLKQVLGSENEILSLELNDEHVSQAVHAFIQQKTSELATKKRYNQDLVDYVEKELIARADSTFLWVALACKNLSNVTNWKVRSALEKLPPGLEPLYGRMMEEILQNNYREDGQLCFQILRSICKVFRPLSLEELVTTAGLPEDFLIQEHIVDLIDRCSSFVTVRQGNVYFIHQSAKDYLTTSGSQKLFPGGIHQEHGVLIGRSLSAMSETLQKDMCNLKQPGSQALTAEIGQRLEAIRYMCCFWVDHLVKYFDGNPIDVLLHKDYIEDGGPVQQFLLEHLLHWLEAFSLFGEYNKGVRAILSLESLIPAKKSPNLHTFIHDAKRFTLFSRSAIEKAPLQLYCSALVFAPENSIVQKQFKKDIPFWIQRKSKAQANWDALLLTLEGHSGPVKSVAFSPDGKVVASASGDGTVKLWDAATGAERQTLKGHSDAINLVAFSPDGKVVASASYDRTVRLWDAATGAARQTLDLDVQGPLSFSSSGQCLRTNGGLFRISPSSTTVNSMDSSLILSVVNEWIVEDGNCILWLPPHYRPTYVAVSGPMVVLGHSSGKVSFLKLAQGLKTVDQMRSH